MNSRQKIFTNSVPEALEEGLLKRQVLGGQEFFECVVCRSSMAGIVPAKSHLEGARHIKALQREAYSAGLVSAFHKLDLSTSNLDYISTSEYRTETASNPEDCNELLIAMKRGIVSENLVCGRKFFKCNVCNISCTGIACLKEHMQGEQHNKRLKRDECLEEGRESLNYSSSVKDEDLVEERMVNSSLQYFCKLCEKSCTGKENLNQHLIGKQHLKTKKNRLGSGWSTIGTSASKETCTPLKENAFQHRSKSAAVEEALTQKDTKPEMPFSEVILETASGHYCLICNTSCSNETALLNHLEGPTHYQKLQEQISLQEEMITPTPDLLSGMRGQSSVQQIITPSSSSSSALRRSTSPVKPRFSMQSAIDIRDIKIYLANEPLDNLFCE